MYTSKSIETRLSRRHLVARVKTLSQYDIFWDDVSKYEVDERIAHTAQILSFLSR